MAVHLADDVRGVLVDGKVGALADEPDESQGDLASALGRRARGVGRHAQQLEAAGWEGEMVCGRFVSFRLEAGAR